MLTQAFPLLVCSTLGGVALDGMLGEVKRWHPLVGFGTLATMLERWLNKRAGAYLAGVLAWTLAVLPGTLMAYLMMDFVYSKEPWLACVLNAILLYFCLGLRSLHDHTTPIQLALDAGDMQEARRLTSYIVSRDTTQADEHDLSKAAVESLLENGCDAVFATLFWFMLAGGSGAVLYRLANTLDAMWGYKTCRYLKFGRAAARIDDVLNWVPARLTALSYVVLGKSRLAWRCWRLQAPLWSSPNAGPVMAAGAGALNLSLGGAAIYDGEVEQRPGLGEGPPAVTADIGRAWRLVASTTALWLMVLLLALLAWSGLQWIHGWDHA